jgi:NAD(P)-dependent dehydrogenase (short-subunit alcohol dehydrogenase family)
MADAQTRIRVNTETPGYWRVTLDRMIPPAAEEMMGKRMKAKLTSLDASHVAMLSKPKEVAAVILEAAKSSGSD